VTKRKTFYILAAAAIFAISCSLTNGATMSAAVLKTPTERPQRADTLKAERIPTPSPKRCKVTAGLLNLRAGAGTSYSVLAVLDEGDDLTILTAGDWIEVQTDKGAAGFVNSKYCRIGEIRK
jgi:uncharacterized protein YgiM (DUF1202 family)